MVHFGASLGRAEVTLGLERNHADRSGWIGIRSKLCFCKNNKRRIIKGACDVKESSASLPQGRGVAQRQRRVAEGMEGQSALENPREKRASRGMPPMQQKNVLLAVVRTAWRRCLNDA